MVRLGRWRTEPKPTYQPPHDAERTQQPHRLKIWRAGLAVPVSHDAETTEQKGRQGENWHDPGMSMSGKQEYERGYARHCGAKDDAKKKQDDEKHDEMA